ncbi:P-loop containing nucleoside triphosphate hydrolase protein [Rhizophagus irregularis DAOM 181602=DAOM 197198]|nr:P-loop containing nucleoside triphosphate hydrolase protein [Rhizophagus irregularis DAOM 181602=DAOM 197198]
MMRFLQKFQSSKLAFTVLGIIGIFLSISVNRRKVKNEEAERLYKLVGGCFVDLKFVADESLARQSFEVIEKSILDETEKKFRNAQINPKQKYHKVVRKIINSLLEAKELDFMTYTDFFDNDKEADEILEKNVFMYHSETNTVTFQSQLVELYIKTKADIFDVRRKQITINSNHATTSNQMDTTMQIPDDPLILPTDEDNINSNQVTTSNQADKILEFTIAENGESEIK